MAETEERSLDDFFAKRDKKKRKEKSSRGGAAATASSAASSSAAAAAAAGGVGGSRQAEGGSGAAPGANTATAKGVNKEEDDWKEFEQEEEVDYSGLRVQSMQISEKDDDEGEKREEPRDYSEEPGSGMDKSFGPWNRSATTQNPVVETIVTESPEPVQSSGVYRPPGARETKTRKTPQGPPEIYSDTQFPSLQSTAKHVDTRKY
ncbi:protein CDV3 homolog isoform X2 [Eublepharis macularius]|uniref:Protein CDV3 homolog isoform X2 n=1 Tax=Eublepharis macularius TaxID=481883 RepID=A0AA97K150_EUBMA|nr:protein CDV3 homolog isoform X2 [Eublepharis macularius]